MKKLVLAAFLLTAGMITTENVAANGSTQPIELKKAPQPPAAVLQAFAVDVARFERFGDTQVTDVVWSFNKGKFTATFSFYYPSSGGTEGRFSATYNRQGERV